MILITSVDDKYFKLNGIQFARIYQPLQKGNNAIGLYNIYDTKQSLIVSGSYDEYEIDGSTFASQELTIEALLDVIWSQGIVNIVTNITNNADEEDLTSIAGLLKLKDRVNYKIIRSSFDWTQDLSSYENSILEIRNNHDIAGGDITLPNNITLFFNGGNISNVGTFTGSGTKIKSDKRQIFDSITAFDGTWDLEEGIFPQWFGALFDGVDDFQALVDSINFASSVNSKKIVFSGGEYGLNSNDLDLSSSGLDADGIIFEFKNSFISSYGIITGFNTKIEETYCKIFDLSGSFAGNFKIKFACPEWFGAVADGVTDCTSAIQAAINMNNNVFFVGGEDAYLISGTISAVTEGGNWTWFGLNRGGYFDANGDAVSVIHCSGDNGNVPFINPPRDLKDLRFEGDAKQGTCLQISSEGNFSSNKIWERLTIDNFNIGIFGYNWFNMSLRNIGVTNCVQGIRIDPGNTPSDDGYFTATNWENIYISDCSSYGLYVNTPFGSKTWSWENVVIERNGSNGTDPQCRLANCVVFSVGAYFEGSSGVPALSMQAASFISKNQTMNSCGEIDFTNNNNVIILEGGALTDLINVLNSISSVISLKGVFGSNFDYKSLGENVPVEIFRSVLSDGAGGTETVVNYSTNHKIGKGLTFAQSTPVEGLLMYSAVITKTVVAGTKEILTDNIYAYGIWANLNTAAYATLIPNGTDTTGIDIIVYICPASTGSPNYFRICAYNPSASDVILTSRTVTAVVIKSTPIN